MDCSATMTFTPVQNRLTMLQTCTESSNDAGRRLHFTECDCGVQRVISDKLQLTTQCTVSGTLRRRLDKLVKRITTVAPTRILQAQPVNQSLTCQSLNCQSITHL